MHTTTITPAVFTFAVPKLHGRGEARVLYVVLRLSVSWQIYSGPSEAPTKIGFSVV